MAEHSNEAIERVINDGKAANRQEAIELLDRVDEIEDEDVGDEDTEEDTHDDEGDDEDDDDE